MNPPSIEKGKLPLPKHWPTGVQSAVLHIIGLAHTVMTYTRGWAANSLNARIRLQAEVERLTNEGALLYEELRIKSKHLRRIRIPFRKEGLRRLLRTYRTWFNNHRVHQGLAGKTPAEQAGPVIVVPLRLEPRLRWPIPMGNDGTPVAVRLAKPLAMVVVPFEGHRHLPLVELQLAA